MICFFMLLQVCLQGKFLEVASLGQKVSTCVALPDTVISLQKAVPVCISIDSIKEGLFPPQPHQQNMWSYCSSLPI